MARVSPVRSSTWRGDGRTPAIENWVRNSESGGSPRTSLTPFVRSVTLSDAHAHIANTDLQLALTSSGHPLRAVEHGSRGRTWLGEYRNRARRPGHSERESRRPGSDRRWARLDPRSPPGTRLPDRTAEAPSRLLSARRRGSAARRPSPHSSLAEFAELLLPMQSGSRRSLPLAPELWRCHLALVFDGLRTPDPHPLPQSGLGLDERRRSAQGARAGLLLTT